MKKIKLLFITYLALIFGCSKESASPIQIDPNFPVKGLLKSWTATTIETDCANQPQTIVNAQQASWSFSNVIVSNGVYKLTIYSGGKTVNATYSITTDSIIQITPTRFSWGYSVNTSSLQLKNSYSNCIQTRFFE